MVCSTRFNDDLVDKSALVEENPKEIREVKVDSINDSEECSSSSNVPQCVGPQCRYDFDEGSKRITGVRGETEKESSEDSEDDEDAKEDRNKAVEWTADDQKNLMDLGNSEIERNKRLESLIARRKARKLLSLQVRKSTMSTGNDPCDHVSSVLIPRGNTFLPNIQSRTPGSAPSVLLPMRNPFDLPYDPFEEKPNLMGDSFHQEFLADHQKDMMFCRHESFILGGSVPTKFREGHEKPFFQDLSTEDIASERPENLHLGKIEVNEHKSPQPIEPILNDVNARDHAKQEPQAYERVVDMVDNCHEEDRSEAQTKQILKESINDRSSSSSSSEENITICRENREAILKSLSSFARKNSVTASVDDDQANSVSYYNDPFVSEKRMEEHFFLADRVRHHIPSNSIASDLHVEVSEVSSPRSIPSPDKDSSVHGEDMKKEITSGSEETWVAPTHLSGVDELESRSRAINEVSEQDIIEVGFSRIKGRSDSVASDMLPEKIGEQDSINSLSLSNSEINLPGSIQAHKMDFSPEPPDASYSSDVLLSQILDFHLHEKARHLCEELVAHTSHDVNSEKAEELSNSSGEGKRDVETTYNLNEIQIKNDTKKLDTANNLDGENHIMIKQQNTRDLLNGLSDGNNSESIDHQILSEPYAAIRGNDKPESFKDYEGEYEKLDEHKDAFQYSMPVESFDSRVSIQNGVDEQSVSEVFSGVSLSSNEPTASAVVLEVLIEQGPITSSSCSSPESLLQPKISIDQIPSSNLGQGIHLEVHKPSCNMAEDNLVRDLPPENLNDAAPENPPLSTEDSIAQTSKLQEVESDHFQDHDSDGRLKSFENIEIDSRSLSSLEAMIEQSNPAANIKISVKDTDSMFDKISDFIAPSKAAEQSDNLLAPSANEEDPSICQTKPSKEANFSHDDKKSEVTENDTKLVTISVKDIECESQFSIKRENVVELEPTNSSRSESIEDNDGSLKKIDSDKSGIGPSKVTEENENSGSDVKNEEFRESKLDENANHPKLGDDKDESESNKAIESESNSGTPYGAVFDPKPEDVVSNPLGYMDKKEPSDPPPERERSIEESHIIFIQNEPTCNP